MKSWPLPKDPDDVCDYQFDWSQRLEEDETIATSDFTVDRGSVEIAESPEPSIDGAITTFWLTGGENGESCVITNRVVTSEGRIWDDSARLRIRSTS